MGFWEDVYELRRSCKIPRKWSCADVRPFLAGKYSLNTVNTVPSNQSMNKDGSVKGNYIQRGREAKAWRVDPGKFELIDDPRDTLGAQDYIKNKPRTLADCRPAIHKASSGGILAVSEKDTKARPQLNDAKTAKLHSIVDMGLGFSAMMRLFDKGSKKKLREQILGVIHEVFEVESEKQFGDFHSSFCAWGMKNIMLAERKRRNREIIRKSVPASYGQIAKTLDVVLNVAVHHCHLPTYDKSHQVSKWLNAAVDTKMMAHLSKIYPSALEPWPTTIQGVNHDRYSAIQRIVRRFIYEKHGGKITPVQFDDIYWEALNR